MVLSAADAENMALSREGSGDDEQEDWRHQCHDVDAIVVAA
jgi:hypothetical protein